MFYHAAMPLFLSRARPPRLMLPPLRHAADAVAILMRLIRVTCCYLPCRLRYAYFSFRAMSYFAADISPSLRYNVNSHFAARRFAFDCCRFDAAARSMLRHLRC